MKKILVVSDTHGKNLNFYDALESEETLDLVVHCGDLEGAEDEFALACKCPVLFVAGNNDFFANLQKEQQMEFAGHHILVTHGHNYLVSMGVDNLYSEAVSEGADLVFFGHTHKPFAQRIGDVYLFNPGSLSYPRQEGRRPSYLVLDIDETDPQAEISYEFRYF